MKLGRATRRGLRATRATGRAGPTFAIGERSEVYTVRDAVWKAGISAPLFAEREIMECRSDDDGLFRLDVRGPDHFAPLLGILDDVIAELSG
jgi:hypothetical protein